MVILSTFLVYIPGLILYPFSKHIRKIGIFYIWKLMSFLYLRVFLLSKITKINNLNNKKLPEGGILFIANHNSFADVPLIASCFRISPLMKKEVLKIPGISLLAKYAQAITVGRNDSSSRATALKECVKRLKNSEAIQYYPEGTRSKSGSPKNFEDIHRKLIDMAFELKVHVVPLSLYGTQNVCTPKYELNSFNKIGIEIGAAINPRDYSNKDKFVKDCWEQVLIGYENIKAHVEGNTQKSKNFNLAL
ncbi:MAG: 1-acyl-sn-glycerol-3-phosphate acyltransferase [Halobacteriovoraceae bacterium]|nr:1-acyl-sn-glycerol-3-phosphate acyltransferase [Halobacteriovoraceae bacterium]